MEGEGGGGLHMFCHVHCIVHSVRGDPCSPIWACHQRTQGLLLLPAEAAYQAALTPRGPVAKPFVVAQQYISGAYMSGIPVAQGGGMPTLSPSTG